MKIFIASLLALSLFSFALTSNARDYQLNIPENTKQVRDIAPINGNNRELPYETQEKNGVAVSFNLLSGYLGNTYGYTLRLILRNTGSQPLAVSPKVSLFDGDGFIQSSNVDGIISRATEQSREISINVQMPNQGWNRNWRKERERANDSVLLEWVNSYWLARSYEVPSGTATTGALFYPIADVGKLPLRLVVEVNGEKFEFFSKSK